MIKKIIKNIIKIILIFILIISVWLQIACERYLSEQNKTYGLTTNLKRKSYKPYAFYLIEYPIFNKHSEDRKLYFKMYERYLSTRTKEGFISNTERDMYIYHIYY